MASSSIEQEEVRQMQQIMHDLTAAREVGAIRAAIVQSALWPKQLQHNEAFQDVIVLCSGGMDSINLVEYYLAQHRMPFLLSVYYGQRNVREIEFAKTHAIRRQLNWAVIDLSDLGALLPGNALTDPSRRVQDGLGAIDDMMPVYVPNRNTIFATLAAGVAMAKDAHVVALGLCNSGEHHYPDTTYEFVYSLKDMHEVALGGYALDFQAPFLDWTKARTVEWAKSRGVGPDWSWSCYRDADIHCGTCPACTKRQKGFIEANVVDTTQYLRRAF